MVGEAWFEKLNLSAIDAEDRYRLLEYVVEKRGRRRVMGALGVSRYTVWRMLRRQVRVSDEKLRKLLKLVSEDEFRRVMSTRGRLKALGIVREDGTVDHALIMEILSYAAGDEYLKQLLIRFVAQHFREDVKRVLGLLPGAVTLKWDRGFEQYLRRLKKGRKVARDDTIAYYRSLFKQHLEGRELTTKLVEEVAASGNGWLRTIFRHYARYLYRNRRISGETLFWILETVPGKPRPGRLKIYDIDLAKLKETMELLRERHPLYHLYYLLMYFSGARLEHVVRMVAEYDPERADELVTVDILERPAPRLVCFRDRGFCRYYLGRAGGKQCHWIYFPDFLLKKLEEYAGTEWDRAVVSRYAVRRDLFRPKYLRKLHWQVAEALLDVDVAKFLHSRFGELAVSQARYSNLLRKADNQYPKLMEALLRGLQNPDHLRKILEAA